MVCLDRRLTIEASDGLQNAEKVVSYINQSAELLKNKTIDSATTALEVITEALSISCYSEKLLAMKGEALFMLHKYEEVVKMCEQTLVFAENNYNRMSDEDQKQPLKLWRWSLMSRSYFRMAKFDLALSILQQYEKLGPCETKTEGPASLSAASLRELLRCKNAGNEAFKGGKYREAVEHYSNAIRRSIESRPFTAICLCNRAAAYQALGEVIDAIADCNLAIALDGDYMKEISRRANLHEKIRDYVHAALDFQRLISLLEKHSEKKHVEDLTVARRRLSSVNRNMKQGLTLDLYLILGLKGSESVAEIKKAYHKAALKHHPDKAGKFLARSESGADGDVWKEIFTTIHKDADKLFKIIGEAYAVLSDANKEFSLTLCSGIEIWRIENSQPVPLPKSDYGRFYSGDSYIVLKTAGKAGAYTYDIHFWLGKDTSQDEAGTAAMKAVELDAVLGSRAIQYREIQCHESSRFLSYFKPCIMPLEGGFSSGFKTSEDETFETLLYTCEGKRAVRLKQVPFMRSSLNHDEIFILDTNEKIFQFNGTNTNVQERPKALEVVQLLKDKKMTISVMVKKNTRMMIWIRFAKNGHNMWQISFSGLEL